MKVLVSGAGGFIGHHLARHLKAKGHEVYGVDLEYSKWMDPKELDGFTLADLRHPLAAMQVTEGMDEVYNLAALNGSIEFTTNNKAELMHNNAVINLNMAEACWMQRVKKVFYSSSACVYPIDLQASAVHLLAESDAYPASPDTEYGWEKLFSERVYQAYAADRGMNIRIARFINIYGTECLIDTLKSKAPMALTKKVIDAGNGGEVKIWGTGGQIRTFCHVRDLLKGIDLLMESDITEPLNLGSDTPHTIDDLVDKIAYTEHVAIHKVHQVDKVEGVRTRIPDMKKTRELLGWKEEVDFMEGLKEINEFVHKEI